jgi:aromatic-L-amino-acid decarboxylase
VWALLRENHDWLAADFADVATRRQAAEAARREEVEREVAEREAARAAAEVAADAAAEAEAERLSVDQ